MNRKFLFGYGRHQTISGSISQQDRLDFCCSLDMIGLTEPSQTEGVQPLSTVTEILSSESVLQEKGAGEEKSI